MENLVFENILFAVAVIVCGFALLIYLLKIAAEKYVIYYTTSEIKERYTADKKRKGLKPFTFETIENGPVTFYAVNQSNADKKFKKSGLTLKLEKR